MASRFKYSFIWPKLLMINSGSKFKSDYKELIKKYNVKIKDASDLLLSIPKRLRAWVKNLYIIIDNLNNSSKLDYNTLFRYLLELDKLETDSKRATDYNWSPQIYFICKALVQKNQPILYWLEDDNSNGP
ncbi:21648_t:CDS:2, partial [Cetraspora pellucida]